MGILCTSLISSSSVEMVNFILLLQTLLEACEADLQSCVDRDPACEKFSQCMLYFKGFQAIQCHRLNHWLWRNNRRVSIVPRKFSPCFSSEEQKAVGMPSAALLRTALASHYPLLPQHEHPMCMGFVDRL